MIDHILYLEKSFREDGLRSSALRFTGAQLTRSKALASDIVRDPYLELFSTGKRGIDWGGEGMEDSSLRV